MKENKDGCCGGKGDECCKTKGKKEECGCGHDHEHKHEHEHGHGHHEFSIEEVVYNNNVLLNTMIGILIKKNVITEKEFTEELKKIEDSLKDSG